MISDEPCNQYVYELEQWIKTATHQWNDAKRVLVDHDVSEEEIQQWENSLRNLSNQLNQLNRDDARNHLETTLSLDKINEQCKKLSDEYNHFQQSCLPTTTPMTNDDRPEIDQLEKENASLNRLRPGKHRLPPLPYRYAALEPYIQREIMQLHHKKHHQSYVDGLNKAEINMQEARETGNFDLIRHWEREAAFNGAGHYLHTIFWNVMSPKGGGKPTGDLLQQIKKDFGSYEAFKKHFSEAAKNVEGVGWAIVVWAPRAHRLEILQAEKHQMLSQWDVIPILVLDVWEHAYYLQYKTDKNKYVDNWWNIVNWDYVAKRFREASKLRWKPY